MKPPLLLAVTVVLATGPLAGCNGSSSPVAVEQPDGLEAASVVFKVPEESAGPPYYSPLQPGFFPNDGEWGAVPFERELGCVPGDHNLLLLFDFVPAFPGGPPRPFLCPLTVEGHEHWQHGPGIDPAPRQTQFRGLGAVPIVFAEWDEIQTAIADGVLTLPELLALPSAMVGVGSFYKETDILGISGPHGAGKGMYKISASGSLPDGRSFRFHLNEVLGELKVVTIEFF